MKILLGLLALAFAGGYKTNSKYIYHYEAKIRPSQLQTMKQQFVELIISCTVEIHPVSNEKFFLEITKHNITALLSDPKFTDGPTDKVRDIDVSHLSSHLKKPIKFKWSNGKVVEVYTSKDDARFSVNIKKGIIGLFHVDFKASGKGPSAQDIFTTDEKSVFGKCPTSYSIRDFKVINSKRQWSQIGFNVTKVIDMNNCTESDFEVFNKVSPGPNEQQSTNPLKSSGTIKYNILGTRDAFKIEEVHAVGIHILYLTSKDEGGIDSVTEQRLKMVDRLRNTMTKKEAIKLESQMKAESLLMNVKSFGNIEKIQKFSETQKTEIVTLVMTKMSKVLEKLPKIAMTGSSGGNFHLTNVSTDLLHVVHAIRSVDRTVHTRIWEKCSRKPDMKKWMLYIFSLCGTQDCTLFMQKRIESLSGDLVSHFLLASSCNGNPTLKMVNTFKEILNYGNVKSSTHLTKLAYLGATNIIKTYCKQTICKQTWMDKVLTDALQQITTTCHKSCRPLSNLPATVVLALVENIQRPMLFPVLEKIILNEKLPMHIRVKAVSAVRPLIKTIPVRVRLVLRRVFRDISQDRELRMLCFTVLMDMPSAHVILHIARDMTREPIKAVRRFVYDKWIAMRYTKLWKPEIDTAVRLALELFPKRRIPSRLGMLSNSYHLNWYSKNWTVGALLHYEEMYRRNLLPTLINSKLNIAILGRNITVLEAQLRVEGLEDYMSKFIGSNGMRGGIASLFEKSKKPFGKLTQLFRTIEEKLPTFTLPENEFKIFSQMSVLDKMLHVDETSTDEPTGTKQSRSFVDKLASLIKLTKSLQKGVEYRVAKPLIPVEVIYRMPSLVGVVMTTNLTAMLVPVSVSKLRVNTVPELFSLKMMKTRKVQSMDVYGEQKLCAIADVHGVINFRIPSLEWGAYMRTTLNISTTLNAKLNYDIKTRTFTTDVEAPETTKEVVTMEKAAFHYLKSENEIGGTSSTRKSFENFSLTKVNEGRRSITGDGKEPNKDFNTDTSKTTATTSFSRTTFPATTPSIPTTTTTHGHHKTTTTPHLPVTTTTKTSTGFVHPTATTSMEATGGMTATTTPVVMPTKISPTDSSSASIPSTSVAVPTKPTVPVGPEGPEGPGGTGSGSGSFLTIPIDFEGWKDVEVLGLKRESPRWEEWSLKINGKYVGVAGGKVVLTNTRTKLRVHFHGEHQRVVRISLPGHGFLTVPSNSPCLVVKKEQLQDGQLFVVTKHASNLAIIRTIAHLKDVPREWKTAGTNEMKEMEQIEKMFQTEMVTLGKEFLDEEEKVDPSQKKARLVHFTANGDSVCLTPFEWKKSFMQVVVRTLRTQILRRVAETKGICYGEFIGFKACLHGFKSHPRTHHLPLIFSPMEYRLRVTPVEGGKAKNLITLKVVNVKSKTESKTGESSWFMTFGSKVGQKERNFVVSTNTNWPKTDMTLNIVPHNLKGLEFKKFCMKLKPSLDGLKLSASFDQSCSINNLEVVAVTSQTAPRYYVTLKIKHNSKNVPDYFMKALRHVIDAYVLPTLRSTVNVYARPRYGKEYEDWSKFDISLIRNDTIRFHLKTRQMTYLLDDVKLPAVVKSLPIGTPEVPVFTKMHYLTKPQCVHYGRQFLTFDKKTFHFTPRGSCEHHLLRICDKQRSNIAVTMRKAHESLKRILTVYVDSKKIEITPKEGINEKPGIKINDVNLKFINHHHILDPETKENMLSIVWEPSIKCLTLKHHRYALIVRLVWSSRVSVRISSLFANKTCGLCGNYNGESFDDFVTPEGKLVNDVTKPTLFFSQVQNSAAKIFASSWIATDRKCTKDCPFRREFTQVQMHGKVCLTNFPVLQCSQSCAKKTSEEMVEVPLTCVPPSLVPTLKKYLRDGTHMNLSQTTDAIAKIRLPRTCTCKC